MDLLDSPKSLVLKRQENKSEELDLKLADDLGYKYHHQVQGIFFLTQHVLYVIVDSKHYVCGHSGV